jgi:hypothetical protein
MSNEGLATRRTVPYTANSVVVPRVLPRRTIRFAGTDAAAGAQVQARGREPVGVGPVAGRSPGSKFIESSPGVQGNFYLTQVFRGSTVI